MSVDDSIGAEIQTGRPAVIISGDKANEISPTVIVAFITSQGNPHPHNVSIQMNGTLNRVKCDHLRTIAKERLTRFVCKLSKPEMVRVTGALATAQCIPIRGPESTSQEKENKEIIALKAECEMWKRCYDAVMSQLVELKVSTDLTMRMARRMEPEYVYEESEIEDEEQEPVVEPEPVVEETVVEPEPPKQPEPEQEEEKRVEINTCTIEELKRCGCTLDLAQKIMDNRPYMRVDELRVVDGVTGVAYGILKHKLCCVPVKVEESEQKTEESEVVVEDEEPVTVVSEPTVEKVEINTATPKDLMEKLRLPRTYAYSITGYRTKNGPYVSAEELLDVKCITPGILKNFIDRITINGEDAVLGEVVVQKPEKVPVKVDGKVNINSASAQEICDALGLSKTVCYSIVGYRKREGLYKSIEDLLNVPRFSKNHFEKYKDLVTVGEEEPEPEDEPEDEEPKSDKVNINTASLRELMAVGFEKRAAALIVNERRKYGRFRSLDDLAEIPEITGKILRKLRDKLEV